VASTWQVVAGIDALPGHALSEHCQKTLDAKPILSTKNRSVPKVTITMFTDKIVIDKL
jgi:hypothetical protein